jgi:hypothetical protein
MGAGRGLTAAPIGLDEFKSPVERSSGSIRIRNHHVDEAKRMRWRARNEQVGIHYGHIPRGNATEVHRCARDEAASADRDPSS